MIPKRDLQQLRAEWTLDIGVIEKDYVLGWLLAGIAQHSALAETLDIQGRNVPSQVLLRDVPVLRGP